MMRGLPMTTYQLPLKGNLPKGRKKKMCAQHNTKKPTKKHVKKVDNNGWGFLKWKKGADRVAKKKQWEEYKSRVTPKK
jgi:hypothetical protein